MRPCDIEKIKEYWPKWSKYIENEVNKILLCSPCEFEIKTIEKLFPKAQIKICNYLTWNFEEPGKLGNFDLIQFSNVFMYCRNKEAWLKNIFNKCKFLWNVDLVRCCRGGNQEYGNDGECCRLQYLNQDIYAREIISNKGDIVNSKDIIDLGEMEERIIDLHEYITPINKNQNWTKDNDCSIIMFLLGNLK